VEHAKQCRKLRTFGKITKIDFEERTSKFLYRTKVNNNLQEVHSIHLLLAR